MVTHVEPGVVADLALLKIVGVVDLPNLVDTYTALNRMVNTTGDSEPDLFTALGYRGYDHAHPGWLEMRNTLQDVFGKTAQTLEALAQTITHIVATYEATDGAAAQQVESVWRGYVDRYTEPMPLPPRPDGPVIFAQPNGA